MRKLIISLSLLLNVACGGNDNQRGLVYSWSACEMSDMTGTWESQTLGITETLIIRPDCSYERVTCGEKGYFQSGIDDIEIEEFQGQKLKDLQSLTYWVLENPNNGNTTCSYYQGEQKISLGILNLKDESYPLDDEFNMNVQIDPIDQNSYITIKYVRVSLGY